MNMATTRRHWPTVVAGLCLAAGTSFAQSAKTVIGPSNEDLAEGARELLAGNAAEGVRRTLQGLGYSNSERDRVAGMSNLCAGYTLLNQLEEALAWCDQALELDESHWRALSNRAYLLVQLGRLDEAERDIARAEALAPGSRKVQTVRSLLLDKTNPVTPLVVIDERRQGANDDDE